MNPDINRFEPLAEVAAPESEAERHLREMRAKLDAALADPSRTATIKAPADSMLTSLLRPDGSRVPAHWTTFALGEVVEIKNYRFRVAYIGETSILFEPVGPVLLGQPKP